MAKEEYLVYEVFVQRKVVDFHVNVGSLRAVNAKMALQMARETFFRREEVCDIWVVPAHCIASSPHDAAHLPVHAMDKTYRLPAGYDNAPHWKKFKTKAITIEEVADEMKSEEGGRTK